LSGMECFQYPGTQALTRQRRRTIRADSLAVNGSKAHMQTVANPVIVGSR
jgi:hypothetical protein